MLNGVKLVMLCAVGALALVACGGGAVAETPEAWAARVTATYDQTGNVAGRMQRMNDTDGMVHVMNSLRSNLSNEQNERIGRERITFVLDYHPIWRANRVVNTDWDRRAVRIGNILPAEIDAWRETLRRIDGQIDELWTIGLLIDTPSLFNASGFFAQRSQQLRSRVATLPGEQITVASDRLKIPKAWAAMLMAQNDGLFKSEAPDLARLAQAVRALGPKT